MTTNGHIEQLQLRIGQPAGQPRRQPAVLA
jgi:hypothetical protein